MLNPKVQSEISDMTDKKKYTCMGCRLRFDTADLQRSHFKTEWHLYNLKRKVCKLEPIDLDSFNRIQSAAAPIVVATRETKNRAKQQDTASQQPDQDDDEDEESDVWEDEDVLDDEELLDEDYEGDEAAEMLARVVKTDTCLFCDKVSTDIDANVAHMNLNHGFFIPEEQYVIDLEGLLEYLGFKVGAGLTCIWCNKQFTTLHGVRLHMLYKDHCKIYFNQDKAVEEFKEFYDYSLQETIPMKPINQLELPKKLCKQYTRRFATQHTIGGPKSSSRALVKAKSSSARDIILAPKSGTLVRASAVYQAKKFNAARAKTLLRIGMTHNNAMRGRLRNQNPI